MRFPVLVATFLLAAGCGPAAPCGEDDEGNVLPVCTYDLPKDLTIDYCPGDQWGAADGCNSCACDDRGNIVCTSITCPGATE